MGLAVSRCTDAARLPEILAVMHAAFGTLDIDPPSGALRETVGDLVARLKIDTIFVAQQGEEIAGSVFCTPKPDALYIGRLAVAPSHQRRGIARALIGAAETEARHLALPKLSLRAQIILTSNVALFRACGFEIVGQGTHAGYAQPTFYEMERVL